MSVHNNAENMCCPDFSCCRPELIASQLERTIFVKAFEEDENETIMNMLHLFMHRLLTNNSETL